MTEGSLIFHLWPSCLKGAPAKRVGDTFTQLPPPQCGSQRGLPFIIASPERGGVIRRSPARRMTEGSSIFHLWPSCLKGAPAKRMGDTLTLLPPPAMRQSEGPLDKRIALLLTCLSYRLCCPINRTFKTCYPNRTSGRSRPARSPGCPSGCRRRQSPRPEPCPSRSAPGPRPPRRG